MALEERLNRMAKDKGQDVMRLRRQVAFDRLLARIFARQTHDLVMKGGYALELRMDHARATKDIDLSFRGDLGGAWKKNGAEDRNALQGLLQSSASTDLGDFLEFAIGTAVLDLQNAPYGGYRFPVDVRMAGRAFIRFDIDVAAGDAWIEPHEEVKTHDWFGFAGIGAPSIPVISREQQFAEKLHAYTLPRKTPNSRVKDLFDMYILARTNELHAERTKTAAQQTFRRRHTHPFPPQFSDPPGNWGVPFAKLVTACGFDTGIKDVVSEVSAYCRKHGLAR
jgi:predicted nucleotidyltransferase component of viral defense system